ncbi:MAG: hypothetical protein J4N79_05385 [Chloroflexi bacterium]|nr:hypothetical protein [Chloroflexota bacterium]MCI0775253.1 hypothetical protein [Chloroflexota bacterium]MCI0837341.1 hypothetical protein [Chloroflexota bacterium]MCI0873681.1 hypothetical protein [Chloroflexota bacterium]
MRDPRIDEILERIDEVDSKGKPIRVADMAREVNDYLVEIEKLRSEVDIATRQVVYLSGREQAMRQLSVSVAQTAGANALAPRMDEIEYDFEYQRERLETVSANLKARQSMVKKTQQLISARISSVQKILDAYSNSSPEELDAGAGATSGATEGTTVKRKKIIRRRRVVRRRR